MKLSKSQKKSIEQQGEYTLGKIRFDAGQLAAELYHGIEDDYESFMEDVERYYKSYLKVELGK